MCRALVERKMWEDAARPARRGAPRLRRRRLFLYGADEGGTCRALDLRLHGSERFESLPGEATANTASMTSTEALELLAISSLLVEDPQGMPASDQPRAKSRIERRDPPSGRAHFLVVGCGRRNLS